MSMERAHELKLEPVDLDRMTLVQVKPATQPPATPSPPAVPHGAVHHSQAHELELEPVDLYRMALTQAEPVTPPAPERPAMPPTPPLDSLRLQVIPVGAESPRGLLHHNESFNVELTLDLPEVAAAGGKTLSYKATIYAQNLGSGLRQMVGEHQGSVAPAKASVIDVLSHIATPGAYRLEAVVSLTSVPSAAGWSTSLESSLLHVY